MTKTIKMLSLGKIFKDRKINKDITDIAEENYPKIDIDVICSYCKMSIHPGQKSKIFSGEKIHMKPCWFKVQKDAKKFM